MITKENFKTKGITLVALVITIIILLIIAGVAVSMITGGEGVLNKSDLSAKEYKKQDMIHTVATAELQLNTDIYLLGKEKNIFNLMEIVQQTSNIKGDNYIISIDNVEQSATIIDKQEKIVIDIWLDENGEFIAEGVIVKDLADAIKPTVEYEISTIDMTYGKIAMVKITTTENRNGIAKTIFSNETEKFHSNETEVIQNITISKNGTYKFTAQSANGRKQSVYIEVTEVESAAGITVGELVYDNHWNIEIYARPASISGTGTVNASNFEGLKPMYNIKLSDALLSSMNYWIPYNYILLKGTVYVYCENDYTFSTTLATDDGSSVYLNGELVKSIASGTATSISIGFRSGWNVLEIYSNENEGQTNYTFGKLLSQDENISILASADITRNDDLNDKHWDIGIYARPASISGTGSVNASDFEGLKPMYNIKLSDTRLSSMDTWIPYDYILMKGTAYVYCETAYTLSTTLTTDDGSSIYLNGELLASTPASATAVNVTFNFKSGWNVIEVYVNENNGGAFFNFGKTLSEDSNIKYFTSERPKELGSVEVLENDSHWNIEIYARPASITGQGTVNATDFEGLRPLYSINLSDTRLSSMNTWLPYEYILMKGTSYVYCENEYTLSTTLTTDDGGSVYLNGELLTSTTTSDTANVTFDFKAGWNVIDVYVNENTGGTYFNFGKTLSEDSNIILRSTKP